MSNLVVVAIPDENDRVWKVSSEKIPHLTLLHLGDSGEVSNLDQIVLFVEHAANTTLRRFYLPVDRRGELGEAKADVLFFKKGRYDYKAIRDFRVALLKDDNIRTAHDSVAQFEGVWQPHLTLGYPETPAKPDETDRDFGFYDVGFNKIAVWVDNFEGPEFLLKDYWDEWEALESVPMDVAMSDIRARKDEVLTHFGVKGMRWGVRSETPSVVEKPKNNMTKGQTAALVGLGPVALLNRGLRENVAKNQVEGQAFQKDKKWEKDFQKAKGFGFDDQKFTKDFNDKWKDHDFSKEDWNNPSPTYQKYMDGYFKEMNAEYSRQFADHYGSSPSGKYEAHHVPGTDLVKLRKKETVQHADQVLVTFRITRDDNGFITGLEKIEDSMAQTADLGAEFLEHFGTKGMKWGVRKAAGAVGATSRFVKDVNFESRVESGKARNMVIDAASKDFHAKDLPAIKAKPEHQTASKLKNRLRHPLDPGTKAYRKDVREAYVKRLEKTANSMTNATGDRQYTIRERGVELPAAGGALPASKHYWEVSSRKVQHAEGDEDVTLVEVLTDDDGFITSIKRVEKTLAQSAVDVGADFILEHYGIRGMRWGQRKAPPTAVAPSATSVVPHGAKRKTKVKTEGGENHPASDDAIKVAQARVKLSKSGAAALSNNELREVANRLQLEQQVKQLTTSGGKKFVSGLLRSQGQQSSQQILQKSVKKGGKGARKVALGF